MTPKPRAKRKKMTKPRVMIGYAYAGMWRDGKLGWYMPEFITGNTEDRPDKRHDVNGNCDGEWSYKCKVVITPILNKKGKPIRRRFKNP